MRSVLACLTLALFPLFLSPEALAQSAIDAHAQMVLSQAPIALPGDVDPDSRQAEFARLFAGRAHWTRSSIAEELAYQGLIVTDMVQSSEMHSLRACYYENDPVTRRLIGRHPAIPSTLLVLSAYGVGHYFVSDWLEHHSWAAAQGWHWLTLVNEGNTVVNNARLGLFPHHPHCAAD